MQLPAVAFDLTPLQNAHRFRGIGTYVRGLAERLAAQSAVPIEFWGWLGGEPFRPSPPHTALWLPRFRMPEYRGAWIFAQLAMRQRARRSRVRAVHITDPDALTSFGDRRMLTTVYDLIPLKEGISPRRAIAWAGYRMYLRHVRRAAVLFAISEATAADLVEMLHIDRDRIVVVQAGIDLPEGVAEAQPRSQRPYFLFAGGPNPNKNLDVLLLAMAASSDVDEQLWITGQWLPSQKAALHSRVRDLGLDARVTHLGFVPRTSLPSLLRRATAVVIPSRLEGFGLPVAEGMAAGAVVVHSKIPVLEEISAGQAITFDADSPEELAAALRKAARDPSLTERLRRAGLARAAEITWDEGARRTLATYEKVLQR